MSEKASYNRLEERLKALELENAALKQEIVALKKNQPFDTDFGIFACRF